LLLESPAPSERDPAAAVDDAVPGKPVLFGRGMENPDDLAGGPVVAGEGGHLSVSGDFAAGDRLDHAFCPVFEIHCVSREKNLIRNEAVDPEQTLEVSPEYGEAFRQAQFLEFRLDAV